MSNTVGDLLNLMKKYRLNKPDFQFKKNQGKWQCTCVITMDNVQLKETALGATKREVKAKTAEQIFPVLKQHLQSQ